MFITSTSKPNLKKIYGFTMFDLNSKNSFIRLKSTDSYAILHVNKYNMTFQIKYVYGSKVKFLTGS